MTIHEVEALIRTLVAPERDAVISQLRDSFRTWSPKIPATHRAAALIACQEVALIALKRLPLLETMR